MCQYNNEEFPSTNIVSGRNISLLVLLCEFLVVIIPCVVYLLRCVSDICVLIE